jgi:hypothetical protein
MPTAVGRSAAEGLWKRILENVRGIRGICGWGSFRDDPEHGTDRRAVPSLSRLPTGGAAHGPAGLPSLAPSLPVIESEVS